MLSTKKYLYPPMFVLIVYHICVDFRVSVVTVALLGKLVYHINYVLKFRVSLFTVASFGKLAYHINFRVSEFTVASFGK